MIHLHKINTCTGGGWRSNADSALDPYNGASLLEGARGGEACYSSKRIGIHGQGGFGGGGGGCRSGGICQNFATIVKKARILSNSTLIIIFSIARRTFNCLNWIL